MKASLILIKEYCSQCGVEYAFIEALQEEGLLKAVTIADEYYIEEEQLDALEQYRRWHYDLHINIAGIDALHHIVGKVNKMHAEINALRNRLKLHEGQEDL